MLNFKAERDKYKKEGNTVGSDLIKCLMNSTYGKFSQKYFYNEYKMTNKESDHNKILK